MTTILDRYETYNGHLYNEDAAIDTSIVFGRYIDDQGEEKNGIWLERHGIFFKFLAEGLDPNLPPIMATRR